ncbi:unnamed protein product [Ilex paraguariensis]|uniref:Uncharacterized protein n=1 Tax=Ilex paraguariensis TaxID=185542 RepID=A0ABC8TQ03_9AQUA
MSDKQNIFPAAITKDDRSYEEQLSTAAVDVLKRIGEDGRIIQEFIELGSKVKAAASEAMDEEAALGDIHLTLIVASDPFNRSRLTSDVLIPNTELKAKIEESIRYQELKRHGEDLST